MSCSGRAVGSWKKSRKIAKGVAAASLIAAGAVSAPAANAQQANWSGFYIGGDLANRWSKVDFTTNSVTVGGASIPLGANTAGYDLNGFRGGLFAGYNWMTTREWLVGVEADVGWGDKDNTKPGFLPGLSPGFLTVGSGDTLQFKTTWDASIRGRVGYLVSPSTLIFGTAGVAWQEIKGTGTCVVGAPPGGGCAPPIGPVVITTSDRPTGWTLGVGVETTLASNWRARVEYRYADYGTIDRVTSIPAFGGSVGSYKFDLKSNILKVGISYNF